MNLFLEVIGRREDGYHKIQTIFQEIDLCDRVSLRLTDCEVKLDCSIVELATPGNLCLRAAGILKEHTHCPLGVHIRLEKHIPWGAGLGGGSSNAAAVLKGLNRLWRLNLPQEDLEKLSRRLGADVPFFFTGGCTLGEGIGDRVRPLDRRSDFWLVLCLPPVRVDTGGIYRALNLMPGQQAGHCRQPVEPFIDAIEKGGVVDWCALMYNRLEAPAIAAHPEIRRAKEELLEAGALGVLMSGSGSAVFGVFATQSAADAADKYLRDVSRNTIMVTRPIGGCANRFGCYTKVG